MKTKHKILLAIVSVLIVVLIGALVIVNTLTPTVHVVKQPLEKIDFLIDWTHTPDYTAYYVAKELGFFKEQGFDVNIVEGNGGPDAAKLLSTGTYKIGTTTATSLIMLKSQGGNLKSLAAIYQKTPTGIISLEKTGIEKPKDLYGKKFGYNPSSMTAQEYAAFANKLNLDRSKIQEIEIGWGAEELLAGKIDARIDWITDVLVSIKTKGYDTNVIWLPDYGFEEYGEVLAVNEEFLKQNPEKVKKLTKAVIKGWEYTLNHKDEATAIYTYLFPEIDKEFTRNALDEIEKLTTSATTEKQGFGYQIDNTWKATQDMLYEQDLVENKVSINSLYTNQFLN